MIYEGMTKEGLAIVLGARRRYDGERRNPWNEIECGHHYSRSMSVYSVLLALSGFHYSAPEQSMAFEPRVNARDFKSFYSVASGWGVYAQRVKGGRTEVSLDVRCGSLTLRVLAAGVGKVKGRKVSVKLGGKDLETELKMKSGTATWEFAEAIRIEKDQKLKIVVR
jgi:hypothetical protein